MQDFYRIDGSSFLYDLLSKLKKARENAYYIGNSTNHFIPGKLRPEWKVFIDTLMLKIERGVKQCQINRIEKNTEKSYLGNPGKRSTIHRHLQRMRCGYYLSLAETFLQ
ncbi:MAG: hypothetical protein U9N35_00650 [Euryarchaeota archaeon]|nr:hypothetical protein [Euryarchaeota archaeon]